MRVWDVSPGYLNRQSLLGEHRELHGLHSILVNGKKGYSRHPETMRWAGALTGLSCRHRLLAAEMALRGYTDKTPLAWRPSSTAWPRIFVTEPLDQMALLQKKYRGLEKGRIALPRNPQELWAHHKYSVMARSPEEYRRYGRAVSRLSQRCMPALARELTAILRERPDRGRARNAVEHMWGYVKPFARNDDLARAMSTTAGMLETTQRLAREHSVAYLLSSTALSELAIWRLDV
jgi:hypothetical protein